MAGALEGIKVVEMANYISGPFASLLLADLGAEVVKVEMPEHPRMGAVRLVGNGVRMSETPPRMSLPPPTGGEHTAEILQRLGYGAESMAKLHEKGVI